MLYGGDKFPSRKKKTDKMHVFDIATHWNVVALEMPKLFVLYKGCHAFATEAATERAFSSQAIVHYEVRNLPSPTIANCLLKIRWNWEKVKQLQIR